MTEPDRSLDKYNFVLYVPELRHQEFTVNDAGHVVLDIAISPVKRLMGKLVNREPVSDIELDELSSSAWLSIDGERSILEIARIQSGKTGDDIDDSAQRIAKFMRYLAKRGWIRFKEVKGV